MKAVIRRQDLPGLIIIAVIGLGLTFLGYTKVRNALETRSWPVTSGTVTSSAVGGAMKYYPSVSYAYIVDNVEYSSNVINNISFNTKNRSAVVKFLEKYPLGSEIKVYYNKLKPSDALLEPGVNSGHFYLLAFGIFLLAVPVLLVVFMKVEFRKQV